MLIQQYIHPMSSSGVITSFVTILIIIFTISPLILSSPASDNVTKVLNDLMKKPYDKRLRPFLGENALFVRININLEALLDVNDQNSEISVRMMLKQSWMEPRLTFNTGMVPNDTVQLVPEQTRMLWLPDTTIGNQRKLVKLEGQEITLLSAEGLVTTSVKISLTTDCAMTFDYFPFDIQTCSIKFLSNTHDRRDIIYEWVTEDLNLGGKESISLMSGRFKLISYDTQTFDVKSTNQVNSITLVLRLHFKALWKKYLISVYIPLISFTGISLISLWILSSNIGILVSLLNIALLNISLVTMSRDGSIRISDTMIKQYLSLCFLFIIISFFVHLLKIWLENHPKQDQLNESPENLTGQAVLTIMDEKIDEERIEMEHISLQNEGIVAKLSKPSMNDYRKLYFRKIRTGIERFLHHVHWILLGTFVILNIFYFGSHINSQESGIENLVRNIAS